MTGLAITAMAWSAILSRAFVQFSSSIVVRLSVPLVLLALLLVPLPNIAAAEVLRGMFGDFSYSTLTLLALSLIRSLSGYRLFPKQQYLGTFWAILAFSVVFYPTSLGIGGVDIYSFGYHPEGVLVLIAMVGLIAWQEENYLLVLLIASACTAYSLDVMESDNFWDYLLDPFLMLYALGYSLLALFPSRKNA